MLYDLNVPWSADQNPSELQRIISFLSEVGYNTLALNHTITGAIPAQITNPIPLELPFKLPPKVTILRRCTLPIADPTHNHRLPALSSAYDILALRPTTEKAFLSACQTLTEHSLISLDLTVRYPFHFKPKPFMTAIHRGIRFEICYSKMVEGDSNARRNFISNCLGILRATRGRGLVVSSESRSVLGVRAPADVLNLLSVWGLARERGMESIGVNPRGVVINEGLKRSAFRGVVDVIDGGHEGFVDPKKDKEKETPVKGSDKKGKGKRKAEETNLDGAGTPQMSKRATKRAKLKALQEASSSAPTPSKDTPTPSESDAPSIKNKANG
jgi:ribonuclease P/MRP protein subunit RPP1